MTETRNIISSLEGVLRTADLSIVHGYTVRAAIGELDRLDLVAARLPGLKNNIRRQGETIMGLYRDLNVARDVHMRNYAPREELAEQERLNANQAATIRSCHETINGLIAANARLEARDASWTAERNLRHDHSAALHKIKGLETNAERGMERIAELERHLERAHARAQEVRISNGFAHPGNRVPELERRITDLTGALRIANEQIGALKDERDRLSNDLGHAREAGRTYANSVGALDAELAKFKSGRALCHPPAGCPVLYRWPGSYDPCGHYTPPHYARFLECNTPRPRTAIERLPYILNGRKGAR